MDTSLPTDTVIRRFILLTSEAVAELPERQAIARELLGTVEPWLNAVIRRKGLHRLPDVRAELLQIFVRMLLESGIAAYEASSNAGSYVWHTLLDAGDELRKLARESRRCTSGINYSAIESPQKHPGDRLDMLQTYEETVKFINSLKRNLREPLLASLAGSDAVRALAQRERRPESWVRVRASRAKACVRDRCRRRQKRAELKS